MKPRGQFSRVADKLVVLGGVQSRPLLRWRCYRRSERFCKFIAIYFPVTFVLEEVAFRGALDAHIHHDGDGRGWQSRCRLSAPG